MGFLVGLLGGGSKPKTQATAAAGVQFQSSAQGLPVALVFGTCVVAPNMIWYGDFVATQQASSSGGGGKGGGSGGKGGGGSSFTYAASFEFGLCAGPIIGVNNVYVNKQVTSLSALGYSLFTGTAGQAAWGYLTSNHPGQDLHYNYLAYVAASAYAMGNSPQVPNSNFEVQGLFSNSVAQEVYGESYVVGQTTPSGGSGNPITVLYAANWTSDAGVTDTAGNVYTKVGSNPASLQYSVAAGVYTFNSAQTNVQVFISYNASIGADADPSLILNYLLTDPRQGALFPSANIGSLTTWQAYCIANGLLLSPGYTQQNTAASMITDIMKATNSDIVSSGGIITVVPYGDQSITANGFTYTAPAAPLYALADDDFIRVKNQDPVTITRMNPADVYNSINLTCLDRANQYNSAILNAKSQAAIDTYGLRETTVDMRIFANLNAARLSLQLQLHRQEVRNQYSFTLDHRYLLLDPMDIVSITDSVAGINAQWVRILSITEGDNGEFQITAEEYLTGNSNAPIYNLQKGVGYNVNYNASPGNANTPVVFEPPVQIAQSGGIEVDIACSGGSTWGGADIWISPDGNTYKLAGRVNGSARAGVLNGSLASGSDPDTVNTLHVDLTQSAGILASGTQADADANHTLCYVDGEYISYETATLTATSKYDLTYLRRGQFGSTISSHANAAPFARMDGGIFAYPYDKSKIGSTIYIKLLSFNSWGGGQQTLSSVTAYTHVLTGPPLPSAVQNFNAQQTGNVVVFSWTDLQPNDTGLKGYDIAFGTPGSAWSAKELLTEAARGTEMTNAAVPPGTWEFSIRGHDIADNLGAISTVQLIVTNSNSIISSVMQEPSWLGLFASAPSNAVFDNAGTSSPTNSSSYNFTFTIGNNSNRVLIARIGIGSAVTTVSNVTYGGIALTHYSAADITNASQHSEFWYLISPATGSNSLAVTLSGASPSVTDVESIYNADQASPIEAFNTASGVGGAPSVAVTTINAGSIVVGSILSSTLTIASAGGQNVRETASNGTTIFKLDDKGPISPAAVTTLSWTGQGGASPWTANAISIKSYPATVPSNFVLHWSGILIPKSTHTPAYYAVIAAPPTPTTGSVVGGALGLTTYYVKTTLVDATGETIASAEKSQIVAALSLLTVTAPASSGLATGWNVYVSTTTGTETLQNSSPIAFSTNWTEPATGLVAGAALPSHNTTGFQPFNTFVPDPVASASYIAPTVDTGYNESLRVYATMASALGMAQTGAQATLKFEIDTWLTGQSDPATYIPWTIGLVNLRYLNAELVYNPINAGNVSYITDFTPNIDTAPSIEQANSVTIAPGGTLITFPTAYHLNPFVQVTVVGNSALYATAAGISTTGFTAHVWNSSGSDVGGTINWTATGE